MRTGFANYFRCPEEYDPFASEPSPDVALEQGFLSLADFASYGQSLSTASSKSMTFSPIRSGEVQIGKGDGSLAFDLAKAIYSLTHEKYVDRRDEQSGVRSLIKSGYYFVRPLLPVQIRRHLQKLWLKGWDDKSFPQWPVDRTVDQLFARLMAACLKEGEVTEIPFIWFWPDRKQSCAVITHDVETAAGLNGCSSLMDADDAFGIKSSFQIIPENRYRASAHVLDSIRSRGFEINVHDLKHDGHLYATKKDFCDNAAKINSYAKQFRSKGFRSGMLYRNIEWYGALDFSYDMSVPNVGRLDPQPGGCCTVMPYFIGNILEIPVTTIQDYSLFHVLGTYSTSLWKQQIGLIAEQHGIASFIIHPDYLDSDAANSSYVELLTHLTQLRETAGMWIPLPGEVDSWWRARAQMSVVRQGRGWRIEGPCQERAQLAYARLRNDELVYAFAPAHSKSSLRPAAIDAFPSRDSHGRDSHPA